MPEIHLDETDRLDWALKTFKRQVQKSGILREPASAGAPNASPSSSL